MQRRYRTIAARLFCLSCIGCGFKQAAPAVPTPPSPTQAGVRVHVCRGDERPEHCYVAVGRPASGPVVASCDPSHMTLGGGVCMAICDSSNRDNLVGYDCIVWPAVTRPRLRR
jgi:hypothetical protein